MYNMNTKHTRRTIRIKETVQQLSAQHFRYIAVTMYDCLPAMHLCFPIRM